MHYLNTVSAARLVQIVAVFDFSSDCVNAVKLHIYAADVLVRHGEDRDGFR